MLRRAVRFVIQLAASGAAVAGVILLLAGGYCLWRGSCSLASFADQVINASLLTAGVSALSVMGGAMLGVQPNYQVARTAGETTSAERTQQDVRASRGRLSFTLLLAAGAIEAAAVGFLIKAAAGPPPAG